MKHRSVLTLLLGTALCAGAFAQPNIDGQAIPGEFGDPLTSQTNFTGFGDRVSGVTYGSEADQLFAFISGGNLYIGVTGNLEANGNNIHLYLDTQPGGSNSFSLTSNCFNCSAQGMSSVIFDEGFTPEYILGVSNAGEPAMTYVDFHDLVNNSSCYEGANATNPTNGTLSGGEGCAMSGLLVALNNTNEAGVTSDPGNVGDPATATTGLEVSIPLSALNAQERIRILVVITGGAGTSGCGTYGTYMSNQTLPALNVGNPGIQLPNVAWSTCPDFPYTTFPFDFNVDAPGTQWVEIDVPANIPGDVDGNGCVDDADLAAVIFEFGSLESGAFANTDLTDAGIVDDNDLAEVIFNFGSGC